MRAFYGTQNVADAEANSVAFVRRKYIDQMKARYAKNRPINKWKSRYVTCSYILTSLALAINLVTLIALAVRFQ